MFGNGLKWKICEKCLCEQRISVFFFVSRSANRKIFGVQSHKLQLHATATATTPHEGNKVSKLEEQASQLRKLS